MFSALLAAPFPTLAAQDVVPPPPKTWPKPVEDRPIIGYFLADQLEYQAQQGTGTLFWNIEGWLGGDYNKLWVKTEGDQGLSGDNGYWVGDISSSVAGPSATRISSKWMVWLATVLTGGWSVQRGT